MIFTEKKREFTNNITEPKIVIFYGLSGAGKSLIRDFFNGQAKIAEFAKIIGNYPPKERIEISKTIYSMFNTFLNNFDLFKKILTMTTRNMRPGETHMVHYNFKAREEFLQLLKDGYVLEYSENFGNLYGTGKAEVEAALKNKANTAVVLDLNGVKKFKEAFGDKVVAVYLKIDKDKMKQRMIQRNEDTEVMKKRLIQVEDPELEQYADYVIDASDRIDIVLRNVFERVLLTSCLPKIDVNCFMKKNVINYTIFKTEISKGKVV